MKNKLQIIVFLCFLQAAAVTAQQSPKEGIENFAHKTFYYQGNELWLNDTITYQKGEASDWINWKRNVVSSRDGLGQEMESVTETFDSFTQQWIATDKIISDYYYFDDTSFAKEIKTYVKNFQTSQWVLINSEEYGKNGKLIEKYSKDFSRLTERIEGGVKETYTYTNDDELLYVEIQDWSVTREEWIKSSRKGFTKYSKENKEISTYEKRDPIQNKWVLVSEMVQIKNIFGEIGELETSFYTPEGLVSEVEISSFTYDENGNVTERISITGIGDDAVSTKEKMLYDSENELVEKLVFVQSGDAEWIPVEQWSYQFESQGETKVKLNRFWSASEQSWINKTREVQTYEGEKITSVHDQVWNELASNWTNISQTSYEYQDNRLSAKTNSEWDEINQVWIFRSGTEYHYRTGNLLELELDYIYDVSADDWKMIEEHRWFHDEEGNLLAFHSKKNSDGTWQNVEKRIYGWHMFALSTTENIENYTIEVFPNPTKGVLHIKSVTGAISRIAILDENGRLIEAISLDQQSTTVDISHLQSGNYFIECVNGVRKNTFKVVKL